MCAHAHVHVRMCMQSYNCKSTNCVDASNSGQLYLCAFKFTNEFVNFEKETRITIATSNACMRKRYNRKHSFTRFMNPKANETSCKHKDKNPSTVAKKSTL